MPNTFIKIQTITVGSGGAANIEFTSIPQTYTDLKLVLSLQDAYPAGFLGNHLRINGNSSSIYYTSRLGGDGSSVFASNASGTKAEMAVSDGSSIANIFASIEIYFPNYTTAQNKSYTSDSVSEQNATQAYSVLYAGLALDTSAITSITILPEPASPTKFSQYSTATLYGIKSS